MGRLLNIVNQLHRRTARDYLGRMADEKVHCSEVARRFDRDYWDGDRRYGYGGYKYDGRWSVVAKQLVETYSLRPNARILDVGCGRGFLLYEFMRLLPGCTCRGFDVSEYGLATAKEEVATASRPPRCSRAIPVLGPIVRPRDLGQRAAQPAARRTWFGPCARWSGWRRTKFLVVESFRTAEELFNLQCWALTCETFLRPESWAVAVRPGRLHRRLRVHLLRAAGLHRRGSIMGYAT